MDDPRKHKRLPVKLSCCVQCEGDASSVPATVLDVSFGGMAIVASQEMPLGARVEFQHSDFPCSPAGTTASTCRVISVRSAHGPASGFRIGLTFENPGTEFVQGLLQWVQMHALVQKRVQQRSVAAHPQWS